MGTDHVKVRFPFLLDLLKIVNQKIWKDFFLKCFDFGKLFFEKRAGHEIVSIIGGFN